MRCCNTTGPVVGAVHYCVPPLERVNLRELRPLVREGRYFVLHAPRQTGKTSALFALRDLLNRGAEGAYRCVYVNVEVGQVAREDVGRAMRAVLAELAREAKSTLGEESLASMWPGVLDTIGQDVALGEVLARWCEADPVPLILLIDEIDALVGDSLLAVLRQLRAGYLRRPAGFPHSVVLSGASTWSRCSPPSRHSSASTRNTGWGGSTIGKPARGFCFRRSCSES